MPYPTRSKSQPRVRGLVSDLTLITMKKRSTRFVRPLWVLEATDTTFECATPQPTYWDSTWEVFNSEWGTKEKAMQQIQIATQAALPHGNYDAANPRLSEVSVANRCRQEPLATAYCSSSLLKDTGAKEASFLQHAIQWISSKFQRKDF